MGKAKKAIELNIRDRGGELKSRQILAVIDHLDYLEQRIINLEKRQENVI